MCRKPVGDGAKRVTTGLSLALKRAFLSIHAAMQWMSAPNIAGAPLPQRARGFWKAYGLAAFERIERLLEAEPAPPPPWFVGWAGRGGPRSRRRGWGGRRWSASRAGWKWSRLWSRAIRCG